MTAILIVDSVVKTCDGNRVLDGASLRAVPGELRALVGVSGTGKSTLLRVAAGVIPPDSGSVYFTGQAYQNMLPGHIAELGLFFIPDGNLFSDAWTVRDQLEMIRDQFDGRECDEALGLAGISKQADKRPSRLSTPDLRRVEVAAALVRRPRCVLVDDPYRGLELHDSASLTLLFRELAASGVAVVVSGHQVPELLASADRVTWCTGRRTQELGPPRSAARSAQFRNDCLGGYAERHKMTAGSGR